MLSFHNFNVYKVNCGCVNNCPIPSEKIYDDHKSLFSVLGLNEKVGDYVCNIFSSHCRMPIISESALNYYKLKEESKMDIQQLVGKEVRILRRKIDSMTKQKINDEYHIPLTKIKEISFYNNINEYRFLNIKVENDDVNINPSRIILPNIS